MGKPSRKAENHGPNKVSAQMVRISPQKARTVINMVRGLNAYDALRALKFTPRKAARVVEKLIESALSNMEASGAWNIDEVKVQGAWVNPGPALRRYMPRAMGRATKILKRTSHIYVVLDEQGGRKAKPAASTETAQPADNAAAE